jgi:hypothetical protein
VSKRTAPEPDVEILGDADYRERDFYDAYETWKLLHRRWSDAELIALERKGNLDAGREVLWRAINDLWRETLSPDLRDWLIQLVDRISTEPELAKRLIAPRPRRGRRPAARDLVTVDQRETLKARAVAEVEWRMNDPTYRGHTKLIFCDVAVQTSTWPWPDGIKPPSEATVKKWYQSRSR